SASPLRYATSVLSPTTWASAAPAVSRDAAVQSAAQSRKDERKPCHRDDHRSMQRTGGPLRVMSVGLVLSATFPLHPQKPTSERTSQEVRLVPTTDIRPFRAGTVLS